MRTVPVVDCTCIVNQTTLSVVSKFHIDNVEQFLPFGDDVKSHIDNLEQFLPFRDDAKSHIDKVEQFLLTGTMPNPTSIMLSSSFFFGDNANSITANE